MDLSDDGTVVVGVALSSQGREAFRWTAETGLVGLGDLAGGAVGSTAVGVSGDGSLIVGVADDPDGGVDIQGLELRIGRPSSDSIGVSFGSPNFNFPSGTEKGFRWSADTGMVALGQVPGGNQNVAFDISDSGNAVVGVGESGFSAVSVRWDENGVPSSDLSLQRGDVHTAACSSDGETFIGNAFSSDLPSRIIGFLGRGGDFNGLASLSEEFPTFGFSCSRDGLFACGGGITSAGSSTSSAMVWQIPVVLDPNADLIPVLISEGPSGATGNSGISGISNDAKMMVGEAEDATGNRAFVIPGLESLPVWLDDFLAGQGASFTLPSDFAVVDVSADGNAIIGYGTNAGGDIEGILISGIGGVDVSLALNSFSGSVVGTEFVMNWNSQEGESYRVESFDEDLQEWRTITPELVGDGLVISHSVSLASGASLFRLSLES